MSEMSEKHKKQTNKDTCETVKKTHMRNEQKARLCSKRAKGTKK